MHSEENGNSYFLNVIGVSRDEQIAYYNLPITHKMALICLMVLLAFVFYSGTTIINQLIREFENLAVLSLQITHVGENLCPACKKKASGDIGFIEEYMHVTRLRKQKLFHLKFFNSFGTDNNKPFNVKIQKVDLKRYLTIHDCGCLQNIAYILLSYNPVRVVGLPSLDYQNVLVEGNESGYFNYKKMAEEYTLPNSKPPLFFRLFPSLPFSVHYSMGNITFGENNYIINGVI